MTTTTGPVGMPRLFAYRPELDGIRAVAVLMVMVAHSGRHAGNGWLGVELFFVLSGFLITTLLVREYEKRDRIDFSVFYAKRALRLFPALAALLVVMSIYVATLADDDLRSGIWMGIWTSAVYVSNWVRAFGSDLEHMGHTWSLAIEEQFYLLWPPILAVMLWAGWTLRRIAVVLVGVVIGVAVWRYWLYSNGASTDRIYNGLDTRLDALMGGALLAVLTTRGDSTPRPPWVRATLRVAGFGGLAVIAAASTGVLPRSPLVYADGISLSAMVCLSVVALVVVDPPRFLVRALSLPVIVWVGVRSYGIYLWHYPLFRMLDPLKESQGRAIYGVIAWTLSFMVAALSFRFVEQPFLAMKSRLRRPTRSATDHDEAATRPRP